MDRQDLTKSQKSQVTFWFVQVVGTMVLLLGVVVAMGALPAVENGRMAPGSNLIPFLTILGVSFALGFILTFIGIFGGLAARARTKKQEQKTILVRELLSKRQKNIGLLLIFASFVALMVSIGRFLLSTQ